MATTTCKRCWTTEKSMSMLGSQENTTTLMDGIPSQQQPTSVLLRTAKIVALAKPDDPSIQILLRKENEKQPQQHLPEGSSLLAIGTSLEEFDLEVLREEKPNVIFIGHPGSRDVLASLLQVLTSIEWVHVRSAGIDTILSDTLKYHSDHVQIITNAKGQFSSTLAEYAMMVCSYFAKNIPRLLQNQKLKKWEKYVIKELRNSTLGIIGYGHIGQTTAKLAKIYGMKVIALRRNPTKAQHNPYCDVVYGSDRESLNRLFAESDYILCSAPLTSETEGMIGKEQFDHANKDAVFINVGRGPIVDESAMIDALKDGRLRGAGLDVFATEPLPTSSELWELDNVLVSSHNMDKTETFLHEATEFFVNENLPRFLHGKELLNPIDKIAGY